MEILQSFYPNFRTSNGLIPRVFGCTVFVHIHKQHRGKLDPHAIKCVFIDYSSTQKGYKSYNPVSHKFYISSDITFNENKPFLSQTYLQGEISLLEDSLSECGSNELMGFESLNLGETHRETPPLESSMPVQDNSSPVSFPPENVPPPESTLFMSLQGN